MCAHRKTCLGDRLVTAESRVCPRHRIHALSLCTADTYSHRSRLGGVCALRNSPGGQAAEQTNNSESNDAQQHPIR